MALISVLGGRFPRVVRVPPRRKLLCGHTWTHFSAGIAAFHFNQITEVLNKSKGIYFKYSSIIYHLSFIIYHMFYEIDSIYRDFLLTWLFKFTSSREKVSGMDDFRSQSLFFRREASFFRRQLDFFRRQSQKVRLRFPSAWKKAS